MENVLRAVKYKRVSTDEQALHGYSIAAQDDILDEYCKEKGYMIVGDYTDEGISGAKPPLKRPALNQLLADVEAGKIDVIIFTKLDRWFRSIEQYYKVQEILERHNVVWQAVLEDYNTATADGRLKVNIMLSVAANERERTSERIKVVFNHKAKNNEYYGGGNLPIGYKKIVDEQGRKRLVKDPEEEPIVIEFFELMKKTNNLHGTTRLLNRKYGISKTDKNWRYALHNEIYWGCFAGVENFCEPYIDKQTWDELRAKRPVKKTQQNKVFLFTGLMKCPICGKGMASGSKKSRGKIFKRYRCNRVFAGLCDGYSIGEGKIEQYLLDHLPELIDQEVKLEVDRVKVEKANFQNRPKTDASKLKEQLRKLNVIYMAGGKTDAEYLQEAAEIKSLLAKVEQDTPPVERDLSHLTSVLVPNWRALYAVMTDENKQRFWRSIIKEIITKDHEIVKVVFV